jgi:hypothetical protein
VTSDLRGILIVAALVALTAGVIYAMQVGGAGSGGAAGAGDGAKPAAASGVDKSRLPYVLEENVRGVIWNHVGRYPSKPICRAAGRNRQIEARRKGWKVLPFRCRYLPG